MSTLAPVADPERTAETSPPRCLTDSDICHIFNCTPMTLRTWLRKGLIPAPSAVVGRRRFWTRAAIDAFLSGSAPEAATG